MPRIWLSVCLSICRTDFRGWDHGQLLGCRDLQERRARVTRWGLTECLFCFSFLGQLSPFWFLQAPDTLLRCEPSVPQRAGEGLCWSSSRDVFLVIRCRNPSPGLLLFFLPLVIFSGVCCGLVASVVQMAWVSLEHGFPSSNRPASGFPIAPTFTQEINPEVRMNEWIRNILVLNTFQDQGCSERVFLDVSNRCKVEGWQFLRHFIRLFKALTF